MDEHAKPMTRKKHRCTGCVWQMRGADCGVCSLPRCVRPVVRLGPAGCWIYRRPKKKCR